jgi:DHA1 family multidrug resistance protein-like MFS transporter
VPASAIIQSEFNVRQREVVTLTTALYVLGLGSGPFVFAPISELYGRQVAYTISMIGEGRCGSYMIITAYALMQALRS